MVLFGLSLVAGQYRSRIRPNDAADLSALAIFDSTSLDLRDAVVPEGENASINATALFGGVEMPHRSHRPRRLLRRRPRRRVTTRRPTRR